MRGKRIGQRLFPLEVRITPAGAGKTRLFCIAIIMFKDHPRRCGENIKVEPVGISEQGSPPQVRGKHCDKEEVRMRDRITPAGAGKPQTAYDKIQ